MNKEKRRRLLRKLLLKKLIRDVVSGKFKNETSQVSPLQNEHGGGRVSYHSPQDRSSYNYGYMEVDEMGAGTPNIW